MKASPTPESLSFNGRTGRLAALAWGTPGAPGVVAVHGWLDNAASFARLAPLLGDYRWVAFDLPGHGESEPRPAGALYHFVDWIGEVAEVVESACAANGWQKVILAGHSLGAAIAGTYAACYPERIEKLVLIDTLGPIPETPAGAPARLARALREARAPQPAPRAYPTLERLIEARARAKEGPLSEASARLLAERSTEKRDGGFAWRTDPRLKQTFPLRLTEPQVLAFLGAIRCPTLLLRATRGLRMTESEEAARASAVPRLIVKTLDGPHHIHLESPAAVAAEIRAFL